MTAAVAFAAFQAFADGKSVYSDAIVWVKGVYDRNGNHVVDTANLRNATDSTVGITGAGVWGAGSNRAWRQETVECQYTKSEITNAPCLYMAQKVVENATTGIGECNFASCRLSNTGGPLQVTNCRFSVVMRIRPEMPVCTDNMEIFGGLGLTHCKAYLENGLLRLQTHCGNYQTSDIYLTPYEWADVAVVPDGDAVIFYAVTKNGAFTKSVKGSTGLEKQGVKDTLFFMLKGKGNDGLVATNNASSTRKYAFHGSVHQFAVWNRTLTEAEVREAFAYPRTDVFRLGLENGSEKEFPLSTPRADPVNPDDWFTMAHSLAAGSSVDIAFRLSENNAALRQMLRVATTSASAAEQLSVTVNGVEAGTVAVVPGGRANLMIPADLFAAGDNVLRLANAGTGTVKFDAIALGGSWLVGETDASSSEFTTYSGTSSRTGYAEDGNSKHFADRVAGGCTNSVVAIVPQDLVACERPVKLTVKTLMSSDPGTSGPQWELLVNGAAKRSGRISGTRQTLSVPIKPGDLNAGRNVLSLVNKTKGTAIEIDSWKFEVAGEPVGTIIFVQ